MSLWFCSAHGVYGPEGVCPNCGKAGTLWIGPDAPAEVRGVDIGPMRTAVEVLADPPRLFQALESCDSDDGELVAPGYIASIRVTATEPQEGGGVAVTDSATASVKQAEPVPPPSCDSSELAVIRAARKRIATAAFDGQAYAAANADWRMNSATYVDVLLGMVDELRAKLATAEQAASVWEEATAQTTEQLRAALTREEAAEKLASAWETTSMFESNRRDAAAQRVSELEEKLLVERSACEVADARAERYRSDLDNCGSTFMALRESSRRSAERAEAAERRVLDLETEIIRIMTPAPEHNGT